MLQLDHLIIYFHNYLNFFRILFIFYSSMIHYFLPKFWVSLKLGKYIAEFDYLLARSKTDTGTDIKLNF